MSQKKKRKKLHASRRIEMVTAVEAAATWLTRITYDRENSLRLVYNRYQIILFLSEKITQNPLIFYNTICFTKNFSGQYFLINFLFDFL